MDSAHKRALRTLWTDRCTVFVREGVRDAKTGVTNFTERKALEDVPCRLSYKLTSRALMPAGKGQAAALEQSVRLFLDRDAVIPPGARLEIYRCGGAEPLCFGRTGLPGLYADHQELRLERWKGWA